MTVGDILQLVRSLVPPSGYQAFADRALWAAGESQKPTAIPALVLVASLSLLVVLAWVGLVTATVHWYCQRSTADVP